MNRRELLTGAAVLAGIGQANAFGIGKEGARGGFGRAGAVLGKVGVSPVTLPITANLGAFYSTVQLSTWAGNCLRVRRSSDNTEQDIGFKGNLVDKAAADTFAAGSNLFISKWYDQSGNGLDLVETVQANQPAFGQPGEWRGIRGISIDGVSTSTAVQKWLQNATLTANRNALTVYQFLTPSSYGNDVQYAFTDSTFATEYAKSYTNAAPLGVNYGVAIPTAIIGRTNPGMVNVSAGAAGIIARHHGAEFTNATVPTSQALGGLMIGKSLAGSTFNGDHNIWMFAFYNAQHTSANMQSTEAAVNATFQPATGFTKRLIYGGSSLITGAFGTLLQNPPYYGGFTYSTEWELFQTAVHGRTLAQEFSLRGDFDTLKDATKLKVVMVIDAPSNDIAVATYADQATAIAAGQTLYTGTTVPFQNNLKTNSIIPIVPTCIARTGFQTGTGNFREDARLAYNAAVVAGGVTNSHAVSDRAADARLSNTADTTYFAADGTHLTNLGYSVLAGIDQVKILAA